MAGSADYRPEWVSSTSIAVIGGIVMTLAVIFYFYALIESLLSSERSKLPVFEIPLSTPLHDEDIAAVKILKPWIVGAFVLALLAYAPPIYQIIKENNPGGLSFTPDSPLPTLAAIIFILLRKNRRLTINSNTIFRNSDGIF